MSILFELLESENGVLYVNFQGRKNLFNYTTFRVGDLIKKVKQNFSGVSEDEREGLFGEGVDCEILKPGSNWRKGRVRISLEFCADEPDAVETPASNDLEASQSMSPLEDIRLMVLEGS